MNIGEMQRKRSRWAEQDPGRKFYGLFDLVCDRDWLRLAHDKRPVDANVLDNLWTLCIPCHQRKTEQDRQRESRVR